MASSCGPYHEEALRRQRVIDRKRAAISRLSIKRAEEEQIMQERLKAENRAKQERHDAKMRELQKHLNDVQGNSQQKRRSRRHVLERVNTGKGSYVERVTSQPKFLPHSHAFRPMTVMGIPYSAYQEIKGKEKILRNNNLYQGHPRVLWNSRAEA